MASIAGMIAEGENVTVTGSGTQADPYVISSAGGDVIVQDAHVVAGPNIVISGVGSEADPYVVSLGPRGEPVAITLAEGVTSQGPVTVRRNPDGSATLDGMLSIPGPRSLTQEAVVFAHLPEGFRAEPGGTGLTTTGNVLPDGDVPSVLRIDLNPGPDGNMFVIGPDIPAGGQLVFTVENLTYWPGA